MASSANADCPQTTIGKCRWYHRQMLMAPRPHRQMPMVSSANADGDLDLVGKCRWCPDPHRQMPMASSANADDAQDLVGKCRRQTKTSSANADCSQDLVGKCRRRRIFDRRSSFTTRYVRFTFYDRPSYVFLV